MADTRTEATVVPEVAEKETVQESPVKKTKEVEIVKATTPAKEVAEAVKSPSKKADKSPAKKAEETEDDEVEEITEDDEVVQIDPTPTKEEAKTEEKVEEQAETKTNGTSENGHTEETKENATNGTAEKRPLEDEKCASPAKKAKLDETEETKVETVEA